MAENGNDEEKTKLEIALALQLAYAPVMQSLELIRVKMQKDGVKRIGDGIARAAICAAIATAKHHNANADHVKQLIDELWNAVEINASEVKPQPKVPRLVR